LRVLTLWIAAIGSRSSFIGCEVRSHGKITVLVMRTYSYFFVVLMQVNGDDF